MIETTDCIARVNGDVKARSNEGEKRANVQRLHRQGFSVDECAALTYDGTIPKADGETQDVRFGDTTSHAKALPLT